jgi:hypothetical protein
VPKRIDITGHQYGKLTILAFAGVVNGKTLWKARCECGTEKAVRSNGVRRGLIVSCGCHKNELARQRGVACAKHGCARHNGEANPTYTTWVAMLARTTNAARHNFKYYGGRGIAVCERWKSFENFLADMGERPAGTTLDRIDVNGNYEPGNCRWADAKTQIANRRISK